MNNFTPLAQQALATAQMKARNRNHNFVGVEHLILGILASEGGKGYFTKLGSDPEKCERILISELLNFSTYHGSSSIESYIPYTPRVKKILALAGKISKKMNHSYISVDHLLYAFVEERDSAAYNALVKQDLFTNSLSEIENAFWGEGEKPTKIEQNINPVEITPRDQFAMAALSSMIRFQHPFNDEKLVAKRTYEFADAMLEARKK